MREAINNKIKVHVEHILAKEVIDYNDYLVLTSYLSKLEAEEALKALASVQNENVSDLFKTLLSVSI